MAKDNQVFIGHIFESIQAIQKYCKEVKKKDFFEDEQLQDSVMRRLEIIGEAVKKISPDFKNRYKEIEWQKIAGMRDVLIHDYFGIDIKLVWNTIKKDLPKLKKQVKELIN